MRIYCESLRPIYTDKQEPVIDRARRATIASLQGSHVKTYVGVSFALLRMMLRDRQVFLQLLLYSTENTLCPNANQVVYITSPKASRDPYSPQPEQPSLQSDRHLPAASPDP